MCGICGYYSFKQSISSKEILEMNKAIRHRGPDDEGFCLSDLEQNKSFSGTDSLEQIKKSLPLLDELQSSRIAVGFRRLSILDLSDKGHQPMLSEEDKVVITFNGEIYNFKAIRKDLKEFGYTFKSETDTEVLLMAYQHYGICFLEKLDGMFALCIVDLTQQKIILARDRMGLKPLFYSQTDQGVVWASEIKSLLKSSWIKPKINWQGVYTNFLFQTTLSPETCFEGIFSLNPATYTTISLEDNKIENKRFWNLPNIINDKVTEDYAVATVDLLLDKSIKSQLFADVKVASMMSGGIDSTLITAKAKQHQDNLNAFTIEYKFSDDEIKNATLMANKINVIHYVEKVNDDDNFDKLKENIQHFEEPYSSLEVLMNAAEFAKQKDFKVVLTGNGADELFGGYSHTLKLNRWKKMKRFNFVRHFIFTNDAFSDRVKNYFSQDSMFDFFRQSQTGMRVSQAKSLINPHIFKKINPDLRSYHLTDNLDYDAYFKYDMRYSLSSHHVFRDDISAMKYGVEFRYPYLSNDLIDYVAKLPQHFRFNGRQNKPLLRKVADKYLHQEVLKMPKRGFSFPLAHYIQTDKKIQDFINKNLECLKSRGFFNASIIDDWLLKATEPYDYVKIWQLVTFELWYQKYFEEQ